MNTNKLLRHINAVRSLRLLSRGQVMSRADIARELGLTRATIGYAIAALTDAGLIIESTDAMGEGRKGRPGIGVQLNPAGAYFVGVDIGTKVLTTVLLDLAMNVISRRVEPMGPNFREADYVAQKLLEASDAVRKEAGIKIDDVIGIGVSVPGLVGRDGRVVNAPFLEWRNYPLRDILLPRCPSEWSVIVCNDAFAFANAERAALTEGSADDLFVMLLAEGIGGATLDEGKIFSGAHGYAGEIGHTQITVAGRTEPFETLAGVKAFAEHLPSNLTVAECVGLLLERQAEAGISHALDDWADAISIGLANVVHLLDPGRVILGGPVSALHALRANRIEETLQCHLLPGFAVPKITVARFGPDGAAIGAAATVREQMFVLPELDGSPITPIL